MGRPEKHSVSLKGHRTSISLEPEFWSALREIASSEGRALNALVAEIDEARALAPGGPDRGLASAIRVHVLGYYQAAAEAR